MRGPQALRRLIVVAGECGPSLGSAEGAASTSSRAVAGLRPRCQHACLPAQSPCFRAGWQRPSQEHSRFSTAAAAGAAGQSPPPAAAPQPPSQQGSADEVDSSSASSIAALKAAYQRSRMEEMYKRFLAREMVLKLPLRTLEELPEVESVTVSVCAKNTTGQESVEKWQMLLHALALEYMTGGRPTFRLTTSKYYKARNFVSGVQIRLEGPEAYDFLEKVGYLLLPNQNAFEGIMDRSISKSGGVGFTVQNVSKNPEFAEVFELFERLRTVGVSVDIRNGSKEGFSRVLLSGLQVPVLLKRRKAGDDEADEHDALPDEQGEGQEQTKVST